MSYLLCLNPRGVDLGPPGLIPKKNKPGKWRQIVDLSFLEGLSINDGIDTDLSSFGRRPCCNSSG